MPIKNNLEKRPLKVLIIGKNGFLGSSLSILLPFKNIDTTAIGRETIDCLYPIPASFDSFLKKGMYNFALICSAISDVEKCSQDPVRSNQVNVTGTIALLEKFKQHDIVPIFFSSDYVFEVNSLIHIENEKCNPATSYGRQKYFVEKYIQSEFNKFLIFRTSKLMSLTTHPKNILWHIVENLEKGLETKCFVDQWINPVFVEDIAEIIKLCLLNKSNGIFHLGSRSIYSRYQIGQLIATLLNFNPNLIQAISLQDISFSEPRPSHHTLDCRKIELELNFQFREINESCLKILHMGRKGPPS